MDVFLIQKNPKYQKWQVFLPTVSRLNVWSRLSDINVIRTHDVASKLIGSFSTRVKNGKLWWEFWCVAVHLFVRVFVTVQSRRVLGQWCPLVAMAMVESPPRGSVGREGEASRRRRKKTLPLLKVWTSSSFEWKSASHYGNR